MSIKENIKDQVAIRKRLIRIYKKNPKSMLELSKEIGISDTTLKTFLVDEKDCRYKVVQKIEDYLFKAERGLLK